MPIQELLPALIRRLEGARSVVIVGVGSELRGDDAAGVRTAEKLQRLLARVRPEGAAAAAPQVHVIIGGTAPENVTGEIKALAPSHLIVIDCADMRMPAGSIRILERGDLDGSAIGTHRMSLGILLDYITSETSCDSMVLAIQPARIELGAEMSPHVARAVDAAAEAIAATLSGIALSGREA
jgi:hydrogenase 3 maturation protease